MKLLKTNPAIGKLSDNVIVERVRSGERELFEILMRRHNQTLFRVIRGYVQREDDASDIMQDTYIKAFYKLKQFKQNAAFSTWLIRIGINESLQWIRKNKRVIPIENGNNEHIQMKEQIEHKTPAERLMNKELGTNIMAAVDDIPEKYRVVFILSEVEQMPQAEISECLNISISNVKVRLHRAKRQIKEKLFHSFDKTALLEFGNTKCDRVVENVMNIING